MTNPNVLDTNWIPQVAALGWLIITCASMISQNRMEITAVRKNMAKVVALNQWDAQNRMGQLEVFMTQWRRIEAVDLRLWPVHLAYFAQRDALISPARYPSRHVECDCEPAGRPRRRSSCHRRSLASGP